MTQTASRTLGFIALTKPRIVELLLITTIPTMFVAERGVPSIWLMCATFIGGAFSAGGANAFNMIIDRDIDRLMDRTNDRPLVTGIVRTKEAIIFASFLEVVAFFWLWGFVNLLAAVLAMSGAIFYVVIYTLWLKRISEQNIVIGGAAGAVPVLVGWAAVTNDLSFAPFILFGVIFAWTPPHFWALAIRYREDYATAGVPMMPVVRSFSWVSWRILFYALITVGLSIWFAPVADMGVFYLVSACVLGVVFLWLSIELMFFAKDKKPMRLFHYSNSYLAVLFFTLAIDQVI